MMAFHKAETCNKE